MTLAFELGPAPEFARDQLSCWNCGLEMAGLADAAISVVRLMALGEAVPPIALPPRGFLPRFAPLPLGLPGPTWGVGVAGAAGGLGLSSNEYGASIICLNFVRDLNDES